MSSQDANRAGEGTTGAARRRPAALAVIGNSNSGKTTLTARLVTELSRRGHRVGSVKHASHGFEIDHKGKDSAILYEAGSTCTVIVSKQMVASLRRLEAEPPIQDVVVDCFPDEDLVIVEGYKASSLPRIEICLKGTLGPITDPDAADLMAIATDEIPLAPATPAPVFSRDDIQGLADLVERQLPHLGTLRRP